MKKIERFAKAHGFKYTIKDGIGGAHVEVNAGKDEFFVQFRKGTYIMTVYENHRTSITTLRSSTQGALVSAMELYLEVEDDETE